MREADEHSITKAALARLGACPDPRLRAVMTALIRVNRSAVSAGARPPGHDPTFGDAGGAGRGSSTGKGETSPVYVAHVALDRAALRVDGREQPITPGMAVTAEIKTGRRRVIDYLLAPLREYVHDGLRER